MVTWLHFWIIAMVSMGFGVTDLVTNGYIGYKEIIAIIRVQSRVIYTARMTLSLFKHGINI